MPTLNIRPRHKPIKNYYTELQTYGKVITISLKTLDIAENQSRLTLVPKHRPEKELSQSLIGGSNTDLDLIDNSVLY